MDGRRAPWRRYCESSARGRACLIWRAYAYGLEPAVRQRVASRIGRSCGMHSAAHCNSWACPAPSARLTLPRGCPAYWKEFVSSWIPQFSCRLRKTIVLVAALDKRQSTTRLTRTDRGFPDPLFCRFAEKCCGIACYRRAYWPSKM